jgi:hypothetical protein
MREATLYREVVKRKIEHSNHYSDLYLPKTSETIRLCSYFNVTPTIFTNNIDGKQWLDIPFMFEPYWNERGL